MVKFGSHLIFLEEWNVLSQSLIDYSETIIILGQLQFLAIIEPFCILYDISWDTWGKHVIDLDNETETSESLGDLTQSWFLDDSGD